MKHNLKSNRKAFTLVELLIVIAIIGILFIVLVSKVDFATDKAKATGVQTDFRSFQVAFETVARENSGFNTFGWDTGDKADNALIAGYTYENADKDGGDRVRNSYDKGDMNLNGICEDGETWTGQKLYTETWTGIYTLDNPADATDMSAYLALEKAINKNLDPALQISIDPENKTIYMANGYQDPWKTEYHGFYLTNAAVDGKDRGAIVMYSDGPNKVFGSEQSIANGIVSVTVKNGGINGQDDLALVICYTYMNGYGEIATTTEGFSNNQVLSGSGNNIPSVSPDDNDGSETEPVVLEAGLYDANGDCLADWETLTGTYQLLADKNFTAGYKTDVNSLYYIIANNNELLDATKLVVKDIDTIGSYAFAGCTTITEIVLPDTITTIGEYAFYNNTGLLTMEFPESVTEMGARAFYGCTNLKTLSISKQVKAIKTWTFASCTNLESIANTEGIETIESYAFWNAESIRELNIPSATQIQGSAFFQCYGIERITIPAGVTRIENDTFAYCYALSEVTLHDDITYIGNSAFNGCPFETIHIPANITALSNSVFANCKNLKSIELHNNIISIGNNAFESCSNLTNITIPTSVTSIGSYAFWGTGLTSITIPDTVTTLGSAVFCECESLATATLPNNLTSIPSDFFSCSGLTSITIPNNVTTIGDYAFQNCVNLNNVILPDQVTKIGTYAFWHCEKLTNITLPESLTRINNGGLGFCQQLTTINFNGNIAQWNNITKVSGWKDTMPSSCIVYCSDGNVSP